MRIIASSKRGQIRLALKAGGAAEALKVGAALGIPEARTRGWIKAFGPESAPTRVVSDNTKRRVFARSEPELLGTIIVHGEQVSEVLWDDHIKRYTPNNQLRDATTKESI